MAGGRTLPVTGSRPAPADVTDSFADVTDSSAFAGGTASSTPSGAGRGARGTGVVGGAGEKWAAGRSPCRLSSRSGIDLASPSRSTPLEWAASSDTARNTPTTSVPVSSQTVARLSASPNASTADSNAITASASKSRRVHCSISPGRPFGSFISRNAAR